MPKLKRDLIRTWLEDHNWTVQRLTAECNALGEGTFAKGSVRNYVLRVVRQYEQFVFTLQLHRPGDGQQFVAVWGWLSAIRLGGSGES